MYIFVNIKFLSIFNIFLKFYLFDKLLLLFFLIYINMWFSHFYRFVLKKKTQNKRKKSRNQKLFSSFPLPKQLLTHSTLNCHALFFSLAKKSSFWQIHPTSSSFSLPILTLSALSGLKKMEQTRRKKALNLPHSDSQLSPSSEKPQRKKKISIHLGSLPQKRK